LIKVILSSGEEMWRVDAYQIPYYNRGIEEAKRAHAMFADCWVASFVYNENILLLDEYSKVFESSSNGSYRNTDEVWWRYRISRSCDEWRPNILYWFPVYCAYYIKVQHLTHTISMLRKLSIWTVVELNKDTIITNTDRTVFFGNFFPLEFTFSGPISIRYYCVFV
jgi:hypothetical protein